MESENSRIAVRPSQLATPYSLLANKMRFITLFLLLLLFGMRPAVSSCTADRQSFSPVFSDSEFNQPQVPSNNSGSQSVPPEFNGRLALEDVKKQVSFGPRVPDSDSHRMAVQFISNRMNSLGYHVSLQKGYANLTTLHSHLKAKGASSRLPLTNIIARNHKPIPGSFPAGIILLAAHFDSRPISDKDPDKRNYEKPIPGANDGASGVAVLLELARILKNTYKKPLLFVFFDGEDYGPNLDNMFLGAKMYAEKIHPNEIKKIEFGILLDMVGDEDLAIGPELNSIYSVPGAWPEIFLEAKRLGYPQFQDRGPVEVSDDHIPLIRRGIRMIDLIDPYYDYWHTQQDTPEHVSAESLEAVGRVVASFLLSRK